jgi:hypothetical protein
MLNRLLVASAALAIAWHSGASAQSTTSIPSTPSCKACSVQLAPVARLGSAEDSAGFGLLSSVVMTRRGEFLVSSQTFVGQIFVFDRNGKFLRSIGRKGQGPGEFNAPLALRIDAHDTVRAIEAGPASRYHVIAPDNTIKRTTPLGVRIFSSVGEADGSIFAGTPSTEGTLSVFDRDGKRTLQFGKLTPNSDPNESLRMVASAPNGTRWSLAAGAYVLERWLPNGTSAQRLVGERDWMQKGPLPTRIDARTQKPPTQMTGLLIDGQGRLFVFAGVADANWKPDPGGGAPDPARVFDTLIEVIDPKTGTLLASTRFDRLVMPMHGTIAYSMIEDDVGDLKLQVWNLSLLQK